MRETNDPVSDSLPGWAQAVLAESPRGHEEYGAAISRAAIMERVRREPRPQRSARRPSASMRASRWTRRGLLTPFGAAALAGVLGIMLSVRAVGTPGGPLGTPDITMSARMIGDTVLPSLRDTLRIVEFVLRGPAVRSAAVVGDFNGWRQGATTLKRRADGTWHGRVVVPRDVVRFAYAVNDDEIDIPARPGARRTGRSVPPGALRARIDSI